MIATVSLRLLYLIFRQVFGLILLLGRTAASKDVELLVLRLCSRRTNRPDPALFEAPSASWSCISSASLSHAGVHGCPVRPLRVGFAFAYTVGRHYPGLQCRSDCSPMEWPIREFTPACTSRGMWCSARSLEPERRPSSRRMRPPISIATAGDASYPAVYPESSQRSAETRSSVSRPGEAR